MSRTKDKPHSKVKQLLLNLLDSGQWVLSSVLLEKTGQKYFDRRLRELRDELGYDIESGFQNGKTVWRLKSKKRVAPKPREYLGKAGKDELLQGWNGTCSLCGKMIKGKGKPDFDHRIPLIRGGTGSSDNFQLLCTPCNNQKRSQCRGCEYDCQKCFLAYPERFPCGVLLRPRDKQTWSKVELAASAKGLDLDEWILQVLENLVKK